MKMIDTGKGRISVVALMGIWSVSALTSLPGLAVSPISEELAHIFPKATELDIQMLTTLPSLLIIPFILLAGFMGERIGHIRLLYIGLSLFLLSGALYFVCSDIMQLIAVSGMLGIGAGIIVPLSTALVPRFFAGEERTRQYGYVSAITNISLVVATAITGWLANIQWRLPFVVYLLPIVSLILVPAIKKAEGGIAAKSGNENLGASGHVYYKILCKYMLYYFFITYLVMVVSINLPFLMGEYGYDASVSGMVISIFFLAMMLPGLFINRILAVVGNSVIYWALLLISLGLLDVFLNRSLPLVVVGCVATGFGYGMAQPYVYDRGSLAATSDKVTYVMAMVMVMNYIAIVVSPFVVEMMQWLFGVSGDGSPFLLNAIAAAVALALMLVRKTIVSKHK